MPARALVVLTFAGSAFPSDHCVRRDDLIRAKAPIRTRLLVLADWPGPSRGTFTYVKPGHEELSNSSAMAARGAPDPDTGSAVRRFDWLSCPDQGMRRTCSAAMLPGASGSRRHSAPFAGQEKC